MGTINLLKTYFISKMFIICCLIMVFLCMIVGTNILAEEYDQEKFEFQGKFIESIRNGEDVEVIKGYLEQGADPNSFGFGDWNSLWEAALAGSGPEVVKLLLNYGAEPDYNDLGRFIVYGCNLEIIELLLENGVDVNKDISNSIFGPYISFNKRFIEEESKRSNMQANIARAILEGYKPPLLIAVDTGRIELAELLIEYGADPDFTDYEYGILLNAAQNNQHPELLRMLLEAGADPNKATGNEYTPLLAAAESNNLTACQLLLEYGADPNPPLLTWPKINPLRAAVINNNIEMIELLLDNGADPEIKYERNKDILHIATENDVDSQVIDILANEIGSKKKFSEYSKGMWDGNVHISRDMKKLLVVKKDEDVKVTYVSCWYLADKEYPLFIWERKFTGSSFDFVVSADFNKRAVVINENIFITEIGTDHVLNKITLPRKENNWKTEVILSSENNRLVLLMDYDGPTNSETSAYENDFFLYLYDLNSGDLIAQNRLPSMQFGWGSLLGFSDDGKYFAAGYNASSGKFRNFYSAEDGQMVYSDKYTPEENEIRWHSFINGKDLISIRKMLGEGENIEHYIDIVDINGELIKSLDIVNIPGIPRMYNASIAMTYDGTSFNEFIAAGEQLLKFKTHQIEDEKIIKVVFNNKKSEWVIVGQNKVHYIPTKAHEAGEAAEQYAEGLELLEYGFAEGVEKIKEALADGLFTGLAHKSGKFIGPDYDLTLKQRAELVLAEYNCLLAGDSRSIIGIDFEFSMSPMGYKIISIGSNSDLNRYPELEAGAVITAVNGNIIIPDKDLTDYYSGLRPGEKITLTINQDGMNNDYEIKLAGDMIDNYDLLYAHRKLFEYGLLAARAGYPQFTLQAAEQIRNFELIYPGDLLWDKVENHIILLEALGIAVRDGSETGFKHMLDNDGILNDDDDDNKNYILNVYLNDYPEYFAPLLADKKKMSYFTKIAENKLPSVQMWEPEKVDFVDLLGNEIAGIGGMQGDGAAGDRKSNAGNELSPGTSSSDSGAAGTVLD